MRLRRWLFAVCLLAAGLYPVAGAAPPACAAETPHAALVVDKGAEVVRLCVEFPAGRSSVTGIELIELAGQQHGLSYRFESFAGVGLAVCMLDGLESTGDGCLGIPYWTYWHGDGSGGWSYASQGAQASTVPAGGVDGWAWGGSSTQPEPTTLESVCPVEKPSPSPSPTPSPSPEATAEPSPAPSPDPTPEEPVADDPVPEEPTPTEPAGDDPAPEPAPATPAPEPKPSPVEVKPRPKPSETPAKERAAKPESPRVERNAPTAATGRAEKADRRLEAVAASREEPGGGPPPAGVAGIGAAILLGGAAALLLRRRRGTQR